MLAEYSPVMQALLGTLFTWGATAAGALVVFLIPKSIHPKVCIQRTFVPCSKVDFAEDYSIACYYTFHLQHQTLRDMGLCARVFFPAHVTITCSHLSSSSSLLPISSLSVGCWTSHLDSLVASCWPHHFGLSLSLPSVCVFMDCASILLL